MLLWGCSFILYRKGCWFMLFFVCLGIGRGGVVLGICLFGLMYCLDICWWWWYSCC